jgi:hypothetical protein
MAGASVALAGCDSGTVSHATRDAPGDRLDAPVEPECRIRARGRLTHVAMDDFDPMVAIAISTAADATDQPSADILANYCLLDRNLERFGKRCFLFLTRTIQPGGEIYVCVNPDGKPTDLHLGE